MRHQANATNAPRPDALTLTAATWLAAGTVLLGLTPWPWHDAALGWTPAFWLLLAPALCLLARRVAGPTRPRRRS